MQSCCRNYMKYMQRHSVKRSLWYKSYLLLSLSCVSILTVIISWGVIYFSTLKPKAAITPHQFWSSYYIKCKAYTLLYIWKSLEVKWWLRGASPYIESVLYFKGTTFLLPYLSFFPSCMDFHVVTERKGGGEKKTEYKWRRSVRASRDIQEIWSGLAKILSSS